MLKADEGSSPVGDKSVVWLALHSKHCTLVDAHRAGSRHRQWLRVSSAGGSPPVTLEGEKKTIITFDAHWRPPFVFCLENNKY